MAPGLIAPLPAEEPRQHHWDALQEDHASASSTAVSSSQASPRLHPTDAHARAKLGVSSGLDAAQGVDLQPLSGADLADEVKKEFQFSTEQCRRLEEILNKWEPVKMPRGTRAYSESSIPTHTAEKRGSSTTPAENKTSRQRLYQATVEDCTESEDDESAPPSPRAAKASGSVEQAVAGGCPPLTFPASAPTSPVLKPALVTESSVPSTTSTAKEVRFSDRVPVVMQRRPSTRISSTRDNPERITGAHLAREISPSSLDKKWGKLFGDNGRPTERLEDVLRGLALYLVQVYKPTNSLVLTPEKMYKFYSKYRLERERIDFSHIFRGTSRDAMSAVEALYLDMQCDYHLVQDTCPGEKSRAHVPALTPEGFIQWAIVLIRAFPEQEASRLARVITDLPLEAVREDPELESGPRERLPRQISKHLFPRQPNESALKLVTESIREWERRAGADRPPHFSRSTSHRGSARVVQNPPPPLVHSDAKSREEHLNRSGRDWKEQGVAEVPRPKRPSPEREGRSSKYERSHDRQESPKQSKRYNSGDSRDAEGDRHRPDRRWTIDGSDGSRHRRREGRSSRS